MDLSTWKSWKKITNKTLLPSMVLFAVLYITLRHKNDILFYPTEQKYASSGKSSTPISSEGDKRGAIQTSPAGIIHHNVTSTVNQHTTPKISQTTPAKPENHHTTQKRPNISTIKVEPYSNFSYALKIRAGPHSDIILALVDEAFVDMAVNLYLTSFRPHFIESFLFVGAGRKACDLLCARDLPCVVYAEDKSAAKASVYGSADFKRKMNIRTYMIIEALNLGYTVIHSDLDVIFFQNPIPPLIKVQADIATLWDEAAYNAGFLIVRPTEYGKGIYREMDRITKRNAKIDDQQALNSAIRAYKKKPKFKVVTLSTKQYLSGVAYFESGHRYFPRKCDTCIVAHNNWIVSKEAKVYRFKEHFMWRVDDGEYYSSTTRKYMSYDNAIETKSDVRESELAALKTALAIGSILDRTVILPKFHCNQKKPSNIYPLNSLLKMVSFDKHFANKYRESTFRFNPEVPHMTENDERCIILTPASKDKMVKFKVDTSKLDTYATSNNTVSSEDIKKWFGDFNEQVLQFHSLYGIDVKFYNAEADINFNKKLKEGFKRGAYRQL